MSRIYSIEKTSSIENYSDEIFILAGDNDERAIASAKTISGKRNDIRTVLLIKYDTFDESVICELFPKANIRIIFATHDPVPFLEELHKNGDILLNSRLLIDITAIRVPELFILFKYLKLQGYSKAISVAYSTPMEYEFQDVPFTSYRSYYGNLKTIDLPGFGGMSDDMSHSQMFIFIGFEGMLSDKVNEDIKYDKLRLINNLPSIYEKYKDISVISNYNLLASGHERLMYVSANNPFEVYNFLMENIQDNETACVAPLSTKPVSLGVCLYALGHENLRVVYPVAEKYVPHRANSVHETYVYSVVLNE